MKRSNVFAVALMFALSILLPFSAASAKEKAAKTAAPVAKVDINSAGQKELEAVPGIGKSTAKKIIAGRPYSSVADLSKAGVSAKTIEQITSLVTVGAASAATPAAAPAPKASQVPAASKPAPAPAKAKVSAPAPSGSGMVWVNNDTKVFHREGSRWYGKTKKGEYMTEADAVKAGYREAKSGKKEE